MTSSSSWMLIHSRPPDKDERLFFTLAQKARQQISACRSLRQFITGFQVCAGSLFQNKGDADEPEAGWQTADEYLSGNVRNKLRMAQLAAESHPEFKINVEALTKAQPKDLEASEIDIRLGATWLNAKLSGMCRNHL